MDDLKTPWYVTHFEALGELSRLAKLLLQTRFQNMEFLARALIAVVYSLAKNPAVQKKVFDEEVSNLNEV